ncbi:unnamed protein product, partial [Phaeothamnion confervicola]
MKVVVATGDELDSSRPGAWSKIVVLRQLLAKDTFDWLVFMDMDAFVMNPSIKLEWLIEGSGGKDILMTEDWNGANTGVFLVRNSRWSRWLLDEWWKQDQFISGDFPFEYEQRGLHFLLQTDAWTGWRPAMPAYPDGDAAAVRAHFRFLPQCAMNSYLVHPFQAARKASVRRWGHRGTYRPGDFVLHLAGKKGRARQRLAEHFAAVAAAALGEEAERVAASVDGGSGSGGASGAGAGGGAGGDAIPGPEGADG